MFRLAQRQARHVVRLDLVLRAARCALRIDVGALVVLVHAVHRNPVVVVVARGVGDEANVLRRRLALVAPLLQKGVQPLAHQRAGAVARLLRDQEDGGSALQVQKVRLALGRKALALQLCTRAQGRFQLPAARRAGRRPGQRRDLRVGVAVVAGDRQIEAVQRPLLHVFPDLQRGVLIGRKPRHLPAARPRPGADLGRREAIRIVQRDVPRAFAAHREAAQQDALVVDLEALLDRRDAFENVRLARPVPAGAVDPAEQIHLDLPLVGHRHIARPERLLAENEFRFRGVVLPAVHPYVEPRRFGRVVAFGQRDGVRLHRSVDRGIVGVNLLLARVPGRSAVAQLPGPLDSLIEHHHRVIDRILRAEQFGILQQNPAGLGVHFDVAHQVGIGVFGPQILHLAFDLLALRADLGEFFGLRLNRRRAASALGPPRAPVAGVAAQSPFPRPKSPPPGP